MNLLLRHLRIADLELFVTAAHLKSLGKAAVLHHLSQSAASAVIQRVETAFGCPLCRHEKRHFRLTHEGSCLVPRIENWIKKFQETVATDVPRPIRLATTHAIARVVIPRILPIETVDLHVMRPDSAYEAVIRDEADMALVPDNAPWEGVNSVEVGVGSFQLYCTDAQIPLSPILLPENQIEVLRLIQRWKQTHTIPLSIKARIPSWSLIADICTNSADVGFLPDFLAADLHPVSWQPEPSPYRILALYASSEKSLQQRIDTLVKECLNVFQKQI